MKIFLTNKKTNEVIFACNAENELLAHFNFSNLDGLIANDTISMLKEASDYLDVNETGYRKENAWSHKKSAGFRCMVLSEYAKKYAQHKWKVES